MPTRAGSFLALKTPDEARAILRRFSLVAGTETVPLVVAAGRVLAEDLRAPEDHPTFARASMDGWAVCAADTFGAGEGLPALLRIGGHVAMGAVPSVPAGPGAAVGISTGACLPPGADAVVMLEHAEQSGALLEVVRPVGVGENVVQIGDDARAGQVLVPAGRRLRAADLALAAAVGVHELVARRRPRVAILSTGDELVPADATPGPAQVRDVNAPALAVQVARAGGDPVLCGIVRDDPAALTAAAAAALDRADVLLVSGGSSAGGRDHTRDVLDRLGPPGVLAHGIAVAPGKPTILAAARDKPVLGLPGYPVSSLLIFELFVAGLIERLGGVVSPPAPFGRRRRATLARQVASKPGREDWVRVVLAEAVDEVDEQAEPGASRLIAVPVRGGTAVISSIVKADGVVCVRMHEEGLPAGAEVEVCLWP